MSDVDDRQRAGCSEIFYRITIYSHKAFQDRIFTKYVYMGIVIQVLLGLFAASRLLMANRYRQCSHLLMFHSGGQLFRPLRRDRTRCEWWSDSRSASNEKSIVAMAGKEQCG